MTAKKRAAPTFVLVAPDVFRDTYEDRPTSSIAVGIRRISDKQVSNARANAARSAWHLHPVEGDQGNRILCFQAELLRELVAASVCDPNDIAKPSLLDAEELTPDGLKSVWDEIDKFNNGTSVCNRELRGEDLETLSDLVELADTMPGLEGARVRRLLGVCFDALMTEARRVATAQAPTQTA